MRNEFLPYYRPQIGPDDIEAVVECLSRGWLTTGPKVKAFEAEFARISGVRHAVALSSCTAALHLGMIALDVCPGDEVIMPSLTFVAGAQCVRQLGAIPVFADINPKTLSIDVSTIEPLLSDRTKVIMPMYYGGQPIGIESIIRLANKHKIAVLEDAAHAVGTLDDGRWPGTLSSGAAFSFYATKNITSAEGGMFLTNDADLAEKVRILSLHGMDKDAWKRYSQGGRWRYDVVQTGYKCNMPDMAATLGISQLTKLDKLQQRRQELASDYERKLAEIPGISPVTTAASAPSKNSWCLYAIAVDEKAARISRDDLIEELFKKNIGTSVHFIPTHTFSSYRGACSRPLPVTDRIASRLISLPLYPDMRSEDVQSVVDALADSIDQRSSSTLGARSVEAAS